ncbi:MAG: molybdenum cofactor guanylyltransferase [Ruminococcaceae bacterium]|nr:molybdenum cofactor guanylyltransferase [Oscillospiraceae bacterium]
MKIANTSAVILAGGKSSRMGRDKGRLKIGDTTFSNKLLSDFSDCFENVYLSVAVDSNLSGTNIIKDEKYGLGPLSGLLAAIKGTVGDNVFICATDMPFADPQIAQKLVEMLGDFDACVVRRTDGKVETAFGVFSKRILPKLNLELDNGKRSIMGLLDRINTRYVDESELGEISDKSFLNVNTPEDYEKLF